MNKYGCGMMQISQVSRLVKYYFRGEEVNPHTLVADLIHPISKSWNRDLVSQLFLPFEVERVISIPLSSCFPADTVCWDLEKDVFYSVKSAYKAWGGGLKFGAWNVLFLYYGFVEKDLEVEDAAPSEDFCMENGCKCIANKHRATM